MRAPSRAISAFHWRMTDAPRRRRAPVAAERIVEAEHADRAPSGWPRAAREDRAQVRGVARRATRPPPRPRRSARRRAVTPCERSLPPAETRIRSRRPRARGRSALSTSARTSGDSMPLTARFVISAGPFLRSASSTSTAKPFPVSSPVPLARESPTTRMRKTPSFGAAGRRGGGPAGGGAPSGSPAAPRRASTSPVPKTSRRRDPDGRAERSRARSATTRGPCERG